MSTAAPLPSLIDWACFCTVILGTSIAWSVLAWRREEAQHRRDAQALADAIEAKRKADDDTRRAKR